MLAHDMELFFWSTLTIKLVSLLAVIITLGNILIRLWVLFFSPE